MDFQKRKVLLQYSSSPNELIHECSMCARVMGEADDAVDCGAPQCSARLCILCLEEVHSEGADRVGKWSYCDACCLLCFLWKLFEEAPLTHSRRAVLRGLQGVGACQMPLFG